MAAAPVLAALTDRVDARRGYLCSTLLSASSALGFALLAEALASALLSQAVSGAGLAGTYMPGLKLLSDHLEGKKQSRAVAFYTSSFGIGGSLSLLLADWMAPATGWRGAFATAALGPLLAGVTVFIGIADRAPYWFAAPLWTVRNFLPLCNNRQVLRYVIGYAAHCWELHGLRAWMVAFFAFSLSHQPETRAPLLSAALLAAATNLLEPLATILGNELAIRKTTPKRHPFDHVDFRAPRLRGGVQRRPPLAAGFCCHKRDLQNREDERDFLLERERALPLLA